MAISCERCGRVDCSLRPTISTGRPRRDNEFQACTSRNPRRIFWIRLVEVLRAAGDAVRSLRVVTAPRAPHSSAMAVACRAANSRFDVLNRAGFRGHVWLGAGVSGWFEDFELSAMQ